MRYDDAYPICPFPCIYLGVSPPFPKVCPLLTLKLRFYPPPHLPEELTVYLARILYQDLQEKATGYESLVEESDKLKQTVKEVRQQLDVQEKESTRLQQSLKEEKQKVAVSTPANVLCLEWQLWVFSVVITRSSRFQFRLSFPKELCESHVLPPTM